MALSTYQNKELQTVKSRYKGSTHVSTRLVGFDFVLLCGWAQQEHSYVGTHTITDPAGGHMGPHPTFTYCPLLTDLCQDFVDHGAVDVGQAVVAALMFVD